MVPCLVAVPVLRNVIVSPRWDQLSPRSGPHPGPIAHNVSISSGRRDSPLTPGQRGTELWRDQKSTGQRMQITHRYSRQEVNFLTLFRHCPPSSPLSVSATVEAHLHCSLAPTGGRDGKRPRYGSPFAATAKLQINNLHLIVRRFIPPGTLKVNCHCGGW